MTARLTVIAIPLPSLALAKNFGLVITAVSLGNNLKKLDHARFLTLLRVATPVYRTCADITTQDICIRKVECGWCADVTGKLTHIQNLSPNQILTLFF
jgi:hypothetical protein